MTRTLGIHSRFGLPRLLWSSSPRRALRASIQIRGEFRTSIFKVFDCFGRHRRALTRASGFPARFSIGWLGRRRHSGRAPSLAAGERLKRARTGILPQPPCPGSSAVNESCYTFVYCSCSNAEFVRTLYHAEFVLCIIILNSTLLCIIILNP